MCPGRNGCLHWGKDQEIPKHWVHSFNAICEVYVLGYLVQIEAKRNRVKIILRLYNFWRLNILRHQTTRWREMMEDVLVPHLLGKWLLTLDKSIVGLPNQ